MVSVLLLAAGRGKRFGSRNKLLLPLGGKPVIQWSLETFLRSSLVHEIFVITRGAGIQKALKKFSREAKKIIFLPGGFTRQESVYQGLQALQKRDNPPSYLLIHNAANPFVTHEEILQCVNFLKQHRAFDGVAVGRPIGETVKMITPFRRSSWVTLEKTLDREILWTTETPQCVRYAPFLEAHQKARQKKFLATDDLTLLEFIGKKIALFPASTHNFKITTEEDYQFARFLIGDLSSSFRVGMAEDTHIFSRTHRGLRLAGLLFPKFPKLEANSDGDIALHAIATAISQALGKGSLGTFADPLMKRGVQESREYLQKILSVMKRRKLTIQHLGLHFEGTEPKIDPLASELRTSLAQILGMPRTTIGITAETGEARTWKFNPRRLRCVATVTLAAHS